MILTNPLENALAALKEEAETDGGREALNALLAEIPFGGALLSLLDGRAQRRLLERLLDLFQAFKDELRAIDRNKIDGTFFETDEFVTLLAIALEQVRTTHDRAKLKILAAGLANSAKCQFSTEARKELFLRILRDLAPEHLSLLKSLAPVNKHGHVIRPLLDSETGITSKTKPFSPTPPRLTGIPCAFSVSKAASSLFRGM